MDEKNLTNEESNFQNLLSENEEEIKENYIKFMFANNVASYITKNQKKKGPNFNKPKKPYWSMSDMVYINYLSFKIYTTLNSNPTMALRINYEKFKKGLLEKDPDAYSVLYESEKHFSI